jgi:hypothetical protein
MKQQRPFHASRKRSSPTPPAAGGLALLSLLLPASSIVAEDVIAPAPAVSTTPAAVLENQNSSPMQVFIPAGPELGAPSQPFQWGPVTLRPHLLYRFLYGDGIASAPGQQQSSLLQQAAPGILVDLGTHWTVDYTPTLNFYSNRKFDNNVNHDARLGWGTAYYDWFFSGAQSCSFTSDPQVETGAQTDQQTYSTALNAAYQFNDKMSLSLGLNQNLNYLQSSGSSTNYTQSLADSQSWSTMDWLNYEFWPRLNAGLGLGLGYDRQQDSPDALSEQYQARVNWRATDKISFQINGGLLTQQYLSGGADTLVSPVFGGTIQYQPFAQTRLGIGASRSVQPSYFQNQFTENTSVNASLNQRLLGWLFLDLHGSYGATHYTASDNGTASSRDDNISTFGARLRSSFGKRGSVAVFYEYSHNDSSQSGFVAPGTSFGYTSSQVGFEIGYRY